MAFITASNGEQYPLWGSAQRCWTKDASDAISFSEHENDLGDGYYASTLYGSAAGNRSWSIGMPSLQGGSAHAIYEGVDGGLLTPVDYVLDLFRYCKTTGRPFVYQDPLTDQYYFARFADKELRRERVLSKLYAASLNIRQARIPGVSVFDPSAVSQLWAYYDSNDFTGATWTDKTGNGFNLTTVTGDVQAVSNAKNGQKIARFNGGAGGGHISSTHDLTVYDFIGVIRIDEAAFSTYGGIVTGSTSGIVLVGDPSSTRFFYAGENDPQRFWKNGVEFHYSDEQAPMEQYGVVHIRYSEGVSISNLQMGRDRADTSRYQAMSVGDWGLTDMAIPMSTIWEIAEHMSAKFRLNIIGQ